MKNVFELSNDDLVRKNSINQAKIIWENHVEWFNKKLTDKNSIFYVAYQKNNFIGYCRLDKEENEEWLITIHICSNERDKGNGKKLLNYVCKKHKDKDIFSYVKSTNIHSCRLFINNNFQKISEKIISYVKYYKFKYVRVKNVIALSNNLYDKTKIFTKKDMIFIKNKKDLTFETLKKINPEYVFFPHWSYIIEPQIYNNFNCIIFHMTDLPFGRGGSPLQNLIERNIYKTKISAIKCVKELDAGDIYLKKDFDISYGTAEEIYTRAGEIISEMIDEIIKVKPIPKPQEGEIVNFKRRTSKQSNMNAIKQIKKIYDHIRMLDANGYPTAYLKLNNLKYEFSNAKLENNRILAQVEIKEDENE